MRFPGSATVGFLFVVLASVDLVSLEETKRSEKSLAEYFLHRKTREERDAATDSKPNPDSGMSPNHGRSGRFPDGGMGPRNGSAKQSILDIAMDTTTPNLPFPAPPGVLVMFMDSHRVLQGNFTLRCPDQNTGYLLTVTLKQISHARVAELTSPVALNLSCKNAVRNKTSDGNEDVLILKGSFNISVSADLLGKGMLLYFLQKHSNNGLPQDSLESQNGLGYSVNPSPAILKPEDGLGYSVNPEDPSVPKDHPSPSETMAFSQNSSSDGSAPILVHQTVLMVLRPIRVIDKVFRVTVYVILIVATAVMGCKTDLKVVKETMKKPVAPIVGFCCQYICMPLIAYGIARSLKLDNPLVTFGIFACGVCPGGGASNMYSYLLGGDLSLSITLTIISTVASLGMIPLWLFTLGATLDMGGVEINIPYLSIVQTLAVITLPLFVGIFLQYKFPKVVKVIFKLTKPMFVLVLIFMLSVGIYANLYIFRLFEPMTILAGCMLPYIGYIIGGVVALICRQPWARVKTIALETGIQNVGVAFLILIVSLPPPDGELAAVGPAASGFMTGFPPFFVTLAYILYNKVKGKKTPSEKDEEQKRAMLERELGQEIVVKGDEKTDNGVGGSVGVGGGGDDAKQANGNSDNARLMRSGCADDAM